MAEKRKRRLHQLAKKRKRRLPIPPSSLANLEKGRVKRGGRTRKGIEVSLPLDVITWLARHENRSRFIESLIKAEMIREAQREA